MRLSLAAPAGALLLILTPLLASPAGAQGVVVKKKVVSADQYQKMTEDATRGVLSGEALHNGDLVSIRRKGQEGRLNGTFVYEDGKNNRILVRPKAGATPVAVPLKDIEEIDRIMPASTEGGKGGVRFASDEAAAARGEIHVLEVFNGPVKEVRYYGANLSPAEKQELAALQKAANDLAADQEAAARLERTLQEQPTPVEQAYQQQRAAQAAANTQSYFAFENYNYANGGMNFGGNYLFPSPLLGGMPLISMSLPTPPSLLVPPAPLPPSSQADLLKAVQSARERVDHARQAYQTARSRAITDESGSIVAVRLDEK